MRFELRETADGSLTVFDHRYGECFKSRHAASTESDVVFLEPAVLSHPDYGHADPFRILELGFGLGTNFNRLREREIRGELVSIDHDLEPCRFFLAHQPNAAAQSLLDQGLYAEAGLRARLLHADFRDSLRQLSLRGERFHSVFFDPFSPKVNAEAWEPEVFALAASLLLPGGRLVTYSVSRVAKDGARLAGLTVEKRELPEGLGKRSALLAVKPTEKTDMLNS